eukprot:540600_1
MRQHDYEEKKHSDDDDNGFKFQREIELAPEILEFNKTYNADKRDCRIEKYLLKKYYKKINSFATFPEDIILRFVIGYRHYDDYNKRLRETDKLFKGYLKWHEKSNFDNILKIKCINNIEIKHYLHGSYIYGNDKYGHPLFWDDGLKTLSNADNSIHKNCGEKGMDNVTCYFARIMHEFKVATTKYYKLNNLKNRNIGLYQHTIILNMNNFSFKRALSDRKIHEFYAQRFSELAPEMLHRMYVINAPFIFQAAWKIISAFLHPNTVKKTKILGNDYIHELSKEIDINMIPKKFGGKGKWKIRYGKEPIGYPIQIDDKLFV